LLQAVGDEDRHDETVDTDDTSHDDGDNVYALLASACCRNPSRLFAPGDDVVLTYS
jgi:hypothetical protein